MKTLHFLILSLTLMTSASAWGQSDDRPPPGGSGGEAGFHKGVQMAFEDQLSATRAALKITPSQAALWQVFEDKVRALMADMTRPAAEAPEHEAAPQKIERSVDVVRDRLTAMEEISAAAKALYAQLDGSQKSIADLRLPITVPPLYSGLGAPARPPQMGGGMRRHPPSGPPQ